MPPQCPNYFRVGSVEVATPGLDHVSELMDLGRYSEALDRLEALPSSGLIELRADVIRAELYERLGKFAQATALLDIIVRNRRASASDLSVAELVRGRIDWEQGATSSALSKIKKAISLATEGNDLQRKCWAQMWLLNFVADRSSPTGAASLLSECRQDAIRLGDPRVWAALHTWCGVSDARRGLFSSASAHIRLSHELLARTPNMWLEACLEFTRTNVAILRS